MLNMVEVMNLSEGNPGAMTFLFSLISAPKFGDSKVIIEKVKKLAITGSDLYVLWSDLGGRSLSRVKEICEKVADHILIDACSRQDYSGRELIKEYMEV